MVSDDEPRENIGAETGRLVDVTANPDTKSRTEAVVDRLGAIYWKKSYGGQDAFRCLVRTILSQNTSDVGSQPAFDSLLETFGDTTLASQLASASEPAIAETIESAGLYHRKARVIRTAAERIEREFGGPEAFDTFVRTAPSEVVRTALLSFDGVGPKTADCVLLFAGGRDGVFPVDTHVHRIARRVGIAPHDADHEAVRNALEPHEGGGVPADKCGFGHTAMIQFGREYCTSRHPACFDGADACPLFDLCDRVGVDRETGTVVDPAELTRD